MWTVKTLRGFFPSWRMCTAPTNTWGGCALIEEYFPEMSDGICKQRLAQSCISVIVLALWMVLKFCIMWKGWNICKLLVMGQFFIIWTLALISTSSVFDSFVYNWEEKSAVVHTLKCSLSYCIEFTVTVIKCCISFFWGEDLGFAVGNGRRSQLIYKLLCVRVWVCLLKKVVQGGERKNFSLFLHPHLIEIHLTCSEWNF